MTSRTGRWGAVISALLIAGFAGESMAQAEPSFVEKPCDIPVADESVAARLRCGTVSVPRDAERPEDGHFEIAVVVKQSVAPRPGASPVLLLHGGPGGEKTRYMGSSTGDFAPGRTAVAFDMRGGGRTGPDICKTLPKAMVDGFSDGLIGRQLEATRLAAISACKAELAEAGFAPAHFGTARNIEDAEAIRGALGIDRWAVYGESYGTTVASAYLAAHPEAIEAVVLDSLYPPDELVPTVREGQGRAIGRLLEECAADAACSARFPGLDRPTVDAALASLDREPLVFHLDGQRYEADELAVRNALFVLSFTEAMMRSLPWFADAVVRRDGEAIAPVLGFPLLISTDSEGTGMAMAGLVSTDCRDRPRHHANATDGGPSWMAMFSGVQSGVCDGIPLGTPPGLPTGTKVPVLVLSAAYDGFQPDGNAVAAAIGPAATPLTIPFAAHVVRGAGDCPRKLVSAFIDAPTQALDTSCISGMTASPFLLELRPMPALTVQGASMMGGTPPVAGMVAIAGAALSVLAGMVLPLAVALWRRVRRAAAPASGRGGLRALAVGGTLIAVAGAVLPVLVMFNGHDLVTLFGLDPTLALALWAVPVGGLLSLIALGRSLAGREWMIAAAALGGALASAGLIALGLVPWG